MKLQDMSDEVEGDFPCAKPFKRNGKKAKKQNSLAFKLSVDTEAKCKELKSLALTPIQETFINSRFEDLDDLEYDDNVESFYSETHEDEGGTSTNNLLSFTFTNKYYLASYTHTPSYTDTHKTQITQS